ncbi:hypothetical protein KKR91_01225 [Arthrobacter jiangjiafuii]|uniref:Uncharacterized protein n=1 Tax=Arthrobacter jiangjiafuii TaxID=2817475 RepID=A0A975M5N8_9MICC|nr:hypothetical protein [Arthrobacter jiangjiafuii]MBP3044871.1 hypothetical protein [Arthrobacter jiangjiafuii]QWC10305.1 hypothetical protein KKR91_01225 [Arthrobacter jiangjiafuii]
MKAEDFQRTAAKAQLNLNLGDPIAIIHIYRGNTFIKGGDSKRDREAISETLIRCSLDELDDRKKDA